MNAYEERFLTAAGVELAPCDACNQLRPEVVNLDSVVGEGTFCRTCCGAQACPHGFAAVAECPICDARTFLLGGLEWGTPASDTQAALELLIRARDHVNADDPTAAYAGGYRLSHAIKHLRGVPTECPHCHGTGVAADDLHDAGDCFACRGEGVRHRPLPAPGDRVSTPAGLGTIIEQRMGWPDYRLPIAYAVRLDARQTDRHYAGSVFLLHQVSRTKAARESLAAGERGTLTLEAGLGLIWILAILLAVGLAWAPDHSMPADDRIVCDAGAELDAEPLDEPGQYGSARVATCYRSYFHGPKVLVVFVD